MILADTDVLIDYLAGIQPVQGLVAAYADGEQLQTTAINCFELLSGAGPGKRGQAVRRLLESLSVLALDRKAAEAAAGVRRNLDRAGQSIGMGDSLIAGIALANDLPLLTRNRSHFARVQGLKLVDIG
jgi:predicted nucleic acid-binding protein